MYVYIEAQEVVALGKGWACVNMKEDNFNRIVIVNTDELRCYDLCCSFRNSCSAVLKTMNMLGLAGNNTAHESDDAAPEFTEEAPLCNFRGSHQKIREIPTTEVQVANVLRQQSQRKAFIPSPPNHGCVCGSDYSPELSADPTGRDGRKLLIDGDSIVSVEVFCFKCSNPQCSEFFGFDGSREGILNSGGLYLISHRILCRLRLMQNAGCSFTKGICMNVYAWIY